MGRNGGPQNGGRGRGRGRQQNGGSRSNGRPPQNDGGNFTLEVVTLKGRRFNKEVSTSMTVMQLKAMLAPGEPSNVVKIIVGSQMMSDKKSDGSDYRISDGPYNISPQKNQVKLVSRFDGGGRSHSGIAEVSHQLKWFNHDSLGSNFIGVEPLDDGWSWNVLFKGPQGSPYQGTIFETNFRFPPDYPASPPSIKFITPIYHPNVYTHSGDLCWHDNDSSGSRYFADIIFAAVLALLVQPNPYSPANSEAASLYTQNEKEYRRKAREHAKQHNLYAR